MMDPAGFEPATHVVRPAFAVKKVSRGDEDDENVLELPYQRADSNRISRFPGCSTLDSRD